MKPEMDVYIYSILVYTIDVTITSNKMFGNFVFSAYFVINWNNPSLNAKQLRGFMFAP